jgi:hypothetical protein
VGEQDNLRKEFDAYWSEERNQLYPMLARDFICKSVCPKLYGMKIIKLALLITLIGGVSSDAYQDKQEAIMRRFPATMLTTMMTMTMSQNPSKLYSTTSPSKRSRGTIYETGGAQTERYKDDAVKTRRRDQSHLL